VKGTRTHPPSTFRPLLPGLLIFSTLALAASAQTPPAAVDSETLQRRVTRARALAAAGNLPSARSELEALRAASAADESLREITLVLLMGIYFEQSDYGYAENLLNDAYRARSPQNEAATRAYYLLAGQVLSGVRSQLDRYREFGLEVTDANLPQEATTHLERLRKLVETVVAQGRQLHGENAKNIDAAALLENASSTRVLLARSDAERDQWQREVAQVRQRLAASNARVAPAAQTASAAPPAAVQAVPPPTPTPTPTPAATPANQPSAQQQQPSPGATPQPSTQNTAARPTATNQPAAAEPVEVGSLVGRATQTVAPTYPQTARAARATGRVTVFLLVDERGNVEAIRRTEGPELLRRAAEDAARRWKFRPTVIDGQPARVTGSVQFNFTL
jgi:protein TonB